MNTYQLKELILQIAGRNIQISTLANNDQKEGVCYIDGAVYDQSENEESSQQVVRKMQWFGFRSRPPEGSDTLVLGPRSSRGQRVLVACDHLQYGPTDLKDGEVTVFSQSGSIIKLDVDGNITLIPNEGAKVRIGSGASGQLDAVALYTQLKADFDAFVGKYNGHVHTVTGTANLMSGAVTGSAAATVDSASTLSSSVASSNVQAKK